MISLRDDFLARVDAFCSAAGIAETTLGKKAVGDATLVPRVRSGARSLTERMYRRFMLWTEDNWPAGAPRPWEPADAEAPPA